jgi:hypothetical protein
MFMTGSPRAQFSAANWSRICRIFCAFDLGESPIGWGTDSPSSKPA